MSVTMDDRVLRRRHMAGARLLRDFGEEDLLPLGGVTVPRGEVEVRAGGEDVPLKQPGNRREVTVDGSACGGGVAVCAVGREDGASFRRNGYGKLLWLRARRGEEVRIAEGMELGKGER